MTERERQLILNALRLARTDVRASAVWARSKKLANTTEFFGCVHKDYERLVTLFEQGGSPLNEWANSQEVAPDQS